MEFEEITPKDVVEIMLRAKEMRLNFYIYSVRYTRKEKTEDVYKRQIKYSSRKTFKTRSRKNVYSS